MLQSAQNGKINYVVTKAVSRFGRSTEDVLVAVRALKEYGVEVYFENQKFGSLSPEAELNISLYCTIAEGENKSHSENVRWGLKLKMSRNVQSKKTQKRDSIFLDFLSPRQSSTAKGGLPFTGCRQKCYNPYFRRIGKVAYF